MRSNLELQSAAAKCWIIRLRFISGLVFSRLQRPVWCFSTRQAWGQKHCSSLHNPTLVVSDRCDVTEQVQEASPAPCVWSYVNCKDTFTFSTFSPNLFLLNGAHRRLSNNPSNLFHGQQRSAESSSERISKAKSRWTPDRVGSVVLEHLRICLGAQICLQGLCVGLSNTNTFQQDSTTA